MKKTVCAFFLLGSIFLSIGFLSGCGENELENPLSWNRMDGLDERLKNFMIQNQLKPPFTVWFIRRPREPLAEMILIGKYPESMKQVFSNEKLAMQSYPNEYLHPSTLKFIKRNAASVPGLDPAGFHQLNYLMFVARKKGEMGNIATLCFLQSGHFVLFNHYVSPRQQEYFRNDQK